MDSPKLKIVLVDDDEDDHVLIQALLDDVRADGFELECLANYDAGLETIGRQEHDVYLIDYRLGERNGLELLREAIAKGCKKPIILLTGQGEYEIDMEAMRIGAADYLEKEWIDGHILERSIRYAIEGKQAEEALRQAHDELERRVGERTAALHGAHTELEQLTYVASHDLQEPLRAIEGFLRFLAQHYEGRLDAGANRLLGRAFDGVKIIQRLSKRLLAYAGVSTQGKPFETTDCSAILNRVIEGLEDVIKESGTVVSYGTLPQVVADSTQLEQVFMHLIGNAINHRDDEPPRIHIGSEHLEDAWLFSVRDNGLGINPKESEQIFYLFSPVHTRRGYGGTGISLAVCKKVVERHGGRIWVESEPGKGSIFYFVLPEREEPPA